MFHLLLFVRRVTSECVTTGSHGLASKGRGSTVFNLYLLEHRPEKTIVVFASFGQKGCNVL